MVDNGPPRDAAEQSIPRQAYLLGKSDAMRRALKEHTIAALSGESDRQHFSINPQPIIPYAKPRAFQSQVQNETSSVTATITRNLGC